MDGTTQTCELTDLEELRKLLLMLCKNWNQ